MLLRVPACPFRWTGSPLGVGTRHRNRGPKTGPKAGPKERDKKVSSTIVNNFRAPFLGLNSGLQFGTASRSPVSFLPGSKINVKKKTRFLAKHDLLFYGLGFVGVVSESQTTALLKQNIIAICSVLAPSERVSRLCFTFTNSNQLV